MTESEPRSAGAPASAEKPAPAGKSKTWLVALTTEAFGPAGAFLDLTDAEARAGVADGVLVTPDATQLAMRPPIPVHPLADEDPQPKG